MEALRRTWEQFLSLYRSMSPSQRGTLIAVPLMVVGAFAFLLFQGSSGSYVPLSWGKSFTSEELMNAEETLREAGLSDYRREGMRLLVPRKQVETYNAALMEGGTLPTDWASELEEQVGQSGLFTSEREVHARKNIALGKALGRMIEAVPEIEHAEVIVAPSESRSRWGHEGPDITATVSIRPRRTHKVSSQLVRSVQLAVAGATPDLAAADVTVFDQVNQRSYTFDDEEAPYDNRILTRIKQFEENYRTRIAEALSHIQGALVSVHVDLDDVKSSLVREQVVDKESTVAVRESEERLNETVNEKPARAEPGVNPNRPRQLQSFSGQEASRTTTESNSDAVTVPSFKNITQEHLGAMPDAVQVSVQIPTDYYRKVAAARNVSPGGSENEQQQFQQTLQQIEQDVLQDIQQVVRNQIPADSPDDAVTVVSYAPVDHELPEVEVSYTDTLRDVFSRWGGAAGLALFALWALWMLNKSMSRVPSEEPSEEPAAELPSPPAETELEEDEEETPMPQTTQRDELQSVVRDNPEMAAAILGKWIQAAK